MQRTMITNMLAFLTIFVGLNFSSNAQDVKVKWGPESDGGDKKSISEPMGWHEGYYYNLRMDYKIMSNSYEVQIEKVNADMKVESIQEVDYESSAYINFEYAKFSEGKIYIISSKFEGKIDKLDVYYETFDVSGKKVGGKKMASFPLKNRLAYKQIKFSLSPDKSMLCGVFSPNSKKEEPLLFNTLVVPVNNFEAKYTSSQKILYSGYGIGLVSQQVDDVGNVIVIIKKQLEKKGDTDSKLYVVDFNGKMSKEQKLEYQDYSLDNISMIGDEDGGIKFTGIYFDKVKKKSFYKGFFLSTFDPSTISFTKFSTMPFDAKVLAFYGERASSKGEASIYGEYKTQIVHSSNNSGGYIIAENLYISSSSDMLTHNFREILVIKYDESEKLTSINFIPKSQSDSYRPPQTNLGFISFTFEAPYGFQKLMTIHTSYSAFLNNDELFIMFNGDARNATANSMEQVIRYYSPSKVSTMLYSINSAGEMNHKVWFDNEAKDGYLIPSKTYSEGDIKVIGLSEKKDMRYGKLIFE